MSHQQSVMVSLNFEDNNLLITTGSCFAMTVAKNVNPEMLSTSFTLETYSVGPQH